MQIPFEFDAKNNIATICGWHANKEEMEANIALYHPGARISHGLCAQCARGVHQDVEQASLLFVESWIGDARKEIAALHEQVC